MPRTLPTSVRRTRRKPSGPALHEDDGPRLLQAETGEPSPEVSVASAERLPFRWLWYLLSLGIPGAGLIIAWFLYDQESRAVRLVGRNCLLVGFVVWILMPLALLALLVLLGTVAVLDYISNALPSVS